MNTRRHGLSRVLAAAVVAVPGMCLSVAAQADYSTRYEYADVVEVQPIVHVVRVETPSEDCYYRTVERRRYRGGGSGGADLLFGGLIGGLIGHQFGKGSGNTLATVTGAVVGVAMGQEHADRRRYHHRDYTSYDRERICDVSYGYREEERVEGYQVTYVYDGQTYTTRMDRDPGERVRVRVSVTPVDY